MQTERTGWNLVPDYFAAFRPALYRMILTSRIPLQLGFAMFATTFAAAVALEVVQVIKRWNLPHAAARRSLLVCTWLMFMLIVAATGHL